MLMLEIGDRNYTFKIVLSPKNLIFMILFLLVKSHQIRVISRNIKKINRTFILPIQALNHFQIHRLLCHHPILVKIIRSYKSINIYIMEYAIMVLGVLLFIEINNKLAKFFHKKVIKFQLYFHLYNKRTILLLSLYLQLT